MSILKKEDFRVIVEELHPDFPLPLREEIVKQTLSIYWKLNYSNYGELRNLTISEVLNETLQKQITDEIKKQKTEREIDHLKFKGKIIV